MGNTQSLEPLPPWTIVFDHGDQELSDGLKERLLAISESHQNFIEPHPDYPLGDFSIDTYLAYVHGAIEFDKRLNSWMPKLIPRRISEEDFWSNYFSHVCCAVSENSEADGKTAPKKSADGGTAVESASTATTSSRANGKVAAAAAGGGSSSQSPLNPDSLDESASDTAARSAAIEAASSPSAAAPAEAGGGVPAVAVADAGAVDVAARDVNSREEKEARLFGEYIEPNVHDDEEQYGEPIRWGILGCGDVCEWKSGPAFQKARGSRLVAVMCRSPAKAKSFAERHHVAKWYTDAKELIEDDEVEAVYVATPPGTHHEYAIMVADAGKTCLVEKPMARTYEECKSMVDKYYVNSLPLFVAYYRRAHPRFIRAKEIVDHHLGQITSVSVRHSVSSHLTSSPEKIGWRIQPEQSGGGLFLDLASHTLDILDFLLGPLDHVYGDAVQAPVLPDADKIDVETAVVVSFRCQQSGAVGSACWNFAAAVREDSLEIVGTAGSMTVSVFGSDPPVLHTPGADGRLVSRAVPCPPLPDHVHQPLIQSVCDELRQLPGVLCPSPGHTAQRTSRVMDLALRKYYRDRTNEFWAHPRNYAKQ